MNRDPKGYYAELRLEPSAAQDAIKAAYRRLAKELHPDRNSNPDAAERFRRVTEAYDALNDPVSRNEYDASQYKVVAAEKSTPKRSLEPICCSRCGKVTAQPRALVFFYAIGAVLVSFRTPVQGIFCSVCARRAALKSSLISAVAGWWAVPWGPIFTVGSILKNAMGGQSSPGVDENLAWFNTLAFMSKGNLALSYALARNLRSSKNKEIAGNSADLMDYLIRHGVSSSLPDLKNPWNFRTRDFFLHLGLLGAMPLLASLLLFGAAQFNQSHLFSTSPPVFAGKANSHPTIPKVADVSPAVPQVAKIPTLPRCDWSVHSGDVLEQHTVMRDSGHVLTIENGSSGDAIIKVRDAYSRRLQFSFFVRANSSASYPNIADGTYLIQYAIGTELGADCKSFIQPSALGQFSEETLETSFTPTEIVHQQLSFTLYPVPNGNVRPQALDLSAFNAE